MDSLWRSTCPMPAYPSLHGDLTTEYAVVGGGLCGLLTAYFLKNAGKDVLLLEGERLCGGATQNTTAKITSQHGLIYDRLIRRYGEKKALHYAQAQQLTIGRYEELITSLNIACLFERLPAHLYSIARSEALESELRAAEKLGLPASLTGAAALPFPAAQALRFDDQAQFHPLRFAAAIAAKLDIREHSLVTKLSGHRLITAEGVVRAKKIILCTHFPFRNIPGAYFTRMHQAYSYVLALAGAGDLKGMWIDASGSGYSFRNAGGLLLLGGCGHRSGEHPYASCFQALRGAAKQLYPGAHEVARWATQDCITTDGVPFIGQFARSMPHVYVATGFNKWGMTGSMVAAELLCDLATGSGKYPFADVFKPQRWSGVSGSFKLFGTPKCPHMGCALAWNPDMRTWDCPCHGSRFSRSGRRVNGPAVRDGHWKL